MVHFNHAIDSDDKAKTASNQYKKKEAALQKAHFKSDLEDEEEE